MNSLNNLLLQLENHIPNFEKTNSKISNSTIGWQIDHCLLVINGVMTQIEISNPTEFQSKFNFNRFMVFTTGKIPRGKIRAPKVVTPFDVATAEELKSKIEIAKNNIVIFRLYGFTMFVHDGSFVNFVYFVNRNIQ